MSLNYSRLSYDFHSFPSSNSSDFHLRSAILRFAGKQEKALELPMPIFSMEWKIVRQGNGSNQPENDSESDSIIIFGGGGGSIGSGVVSGLFVCSFCSAADSVPSSSADSEFSLRPLFFLNTADSIVNSISIHSTKNSSSLVYLSLGCGAALAKFDWPADHSSASADSIDYSLLDLVKCDLSRELNCSVISPGPDDYSAAGSDDGFIRLFSLSESRKLVQIGISDEKQKHSGTVMAIKFWRNPNNSRLFIASNSSGDKEIKIWAVSSDSSSANCLSHFTSISAEKSKFRSAQFLFDSSDNSTFLYAIANVSANSTKQARPSISGRLVKISTSTWEIVDQINCGSSPLVQLELSSAESRIAAIANSDGDLFLFSLGNSSHRRSFELIKVIHNIHGLPCTGIAFSPVSSPSSITLLTASVDRSYRFHTVNPAERAKSLSDRLISLAQLLFWIAFVVFFLVIANALRNNERSQTDYEL